MWTRRAGRGAGRGELGRAPAGPAVERVSQLRPALGPDGRAVIERHGSGYRITQDAIATDAARFAPAVDEGARLLSDNRAAQAFDVLTEASRMWRGEPFADLMVAPDSVRGRLAELREVAIEHRCAAQLGAGDPARAVSEMEGTVAEAPYRERRWALLIGNAGEPAEISGALRRSPRWFVHEGDTSQTLAIVHVAAGQLLADRPHEAVRLQAAALHHAQLRGLAPSSIVQSGHGPIEPELDHARPADAEAEGDRLSWAEMLELVTAG